MLGWIKSLRLGMLQDKAKTNFFAFFTSYLFLTIQYGYTFLGLAWSKVSLFRQKCNNMTSVRSWLEKVKNEYGMCFCEFMYQRSIHEQSEMTNYHVTNKLKETLLRKCVKGCIPRRDKFHVRS